MIIDEHCLCTGVGKLHVMKEHCQADVIGLDWSTDMAEARRVFGSDATLQGNVDPMVLFGTESVIREVRHTRCPVAACLTKLLDVPTTPDPPPQCTAGSHRVPASSWLWAAHPQRGSWGGAGHP